MSNIPFKCGTLVVHWQFRHGGARTAKFLWRRNWFAHPRNLSAQNTFKRNCKQTFTGGWGKVSFGGARKDLLWNGSCRSPSKHDCVPPSLWSCASQWDDSKTKKTPSTNTYRALNPSACALINVIFPSTLTHLPVPAAEKHPHSMIPTPCFTFAYRLCFVN